MSNAEAVQTVVSALRKLGRIEDVDEALVTAWQGLAFELDAADTKDRAGLYREFRAYDAAVRGLGGGDGDDGFAALLSAISGAPVGNASAAGEANPGP